MANEKNNEREELHKTIWGIANELRGAVDGWSFKAYVLGAIFYRYISENITKYINDNERDSDPDFDYAALTDQEAESARQSMAREKGYFILPSQLFCNVVPKKKDGEADTDDTAECADLNERTESEND